MKRDPLRDPRAGDVVRYANESLAKVDGIRGDQVTFYKAHPPDFIWEIHSWTSHISSWRKAVFGDLAAIYTHPRDPVTDPQPGDVW